MEKFQFIDANLHHISADADERLRYAVDLGVCSSFAGQNLPKGNQHFFVSALPWLLPIVGRLPHMMTGTDVLMATIRWSQEEK